jgi:hypothetical protein
MPKKQHRVDERIAKFRASWRELAPTATFAGMTLAQFEAATEPSVALREEITSLSTQLAGKQTERSAADTEAMRVLDLVVNSVRGTPGFGPDSPLYRSFGYVRRSERRSGLTRKTAEATAADANAA